MLRLHVKSMLQTVTIVMLTMVFCAPVQGQQSYKDEVLKLADILKKSGNLSVGKTTLYGAKLSMRMLELNQLIRYGTSKTLLTLWKPSAASIKTD